MRTLFLTLLLASLGACGGSETTNEATGGSTSGGSGGSTSGGASSGGSATGGAAGSTSGGSAGAAASGGSAGSGTGGTSSGGTTATGGAGGTGGATATAGCQPLCDSITKAACKNGPTMAGCLLTCKALTSTAKCDPTANAYFACVKSKGVTCNAAGDPVSQTCGVDYLKAIGCAVNENPNPAIVAPCSTYCGKVVAAKCPGNGDSAECNTNCKWLGATGTGCDDEWGTYLTCANAATVSCVLGFAVAQGCGAKFTDYSKCINAASG